MSKLALAAPFLAIAVLAAVAAQPTPRTVYVAVTDPASRPVQQLNADDFVVRVNDTDAPVVRVQPATEPVAVVVIADLNDPQQTPDERAALRAIVSAVRRANPASRVGLIASDGPANPALVDVTTGAAGLDASIARFFQNRMPAPLHESIGVATRALARQPLRRRAIVALTRVQWDDPNEAPEQLIESLQRAGVALWAIEQWPTGNLTSQTETVLAVAARQSGGLRQTIFDTASLEAASGRLMNVLLSEYAVTYLRPETPEPSALRVGVKRGDVRVFAPGVAGLR